MGCGGSKNERPSPDKKRKTSTEAHMELPTYDEERKAKVIVMGSLSVGKTSIIKAFVDDKVQRGSVQQTNVLQDFYKTVSVENDQGNNVNLKLNIWDAAGDNAIANIAHIFLRDVQLAILVYSIESQISFN